MRTDETRMGYLKLGPRTDAAGRDSTVLLDPDQRAGSPASQEAHEAVEFFPSYPMVHFWGVYALHSATSGDRIIAWSKRGAIEWKRLGSICTSLGSATLAAIADHAAQMVRWCHITLGRTRR